MADLAQGYTADVMLMPGDSVRVSTVGQATVRSAYGAPAGTTTLNANTQTFGPYGVPAKLTITAVSGTANYVQPTQVPVTYDPSTGIVNSPGAVSGAGRILANTARGLVLLDTSAGAGVADTPFAIAATIPGNLMQPTSKLLVWSGVDWTLGNSKNHYIKIGPASQTYATAVQVSGWSGFSTQNFSTVSALICNDGVLNRQRSTPANAVSFLNGSGSQMAVTNIDTTLDWNIYVGIQHGTLNGGASATDRQFFVLLLP